MAHKAYMSDLKGRFSNRHIDRVECVGRNGVLSVYSHSPGESVSNHFPPSETFPPRTEVDAWLKREGWLDERGVATPTTIQESKKESGVV